MHKVTETHMTPASKAGQIFGRPNIRPAPCKRSQKVQENRQRINKSWKGHKQERIDTSSVSE